MTGEGADRETLLAAGVNLAGERAAAGVLVLLGGRGIEPIVLRGPLVTRWLRPRGGARYSTDVDVLVAPSEFESVGRALSGAGYERVVDSARTDLHADTWYKEGAFAVDVHRTVVGAHAPPAVVWDVLQRATESASVDGRSCRVLSAAARGLVIALHAAQHGPRDPRTIDDLWLALPLLTDAQWREAERLAEEIDAVAALAAGLALVPEGERLAGMLELPEVTTTELELRSQGAPETALGFERLARASGTAAKVTLVARELVPHPSFMREWHPVASRGRAGLALAYLIRPFWLARRAVPGFTAWLRARRRAR